MKIKQKDFDKGTVVLKYIILILLFYVVYSIGNFHGLLSGMNVVIEKEGLSICEFLSLEEEDGYCILNKEAKFNQEVSCYFGDFKVEGGAKPSGIIKGSIMIRDFIFGNVLFRCYG